MVSCCAGLTGHADAALEYANTYWEREPGWAEALGGGMDDKSGAEPPSAAKRQAADAARQAKGWLTLG